MNPKIQKGALITIIVLLVIFVPLSAAGIYFKILDATTEPPAPENTGKLFYFDNKLWFYDENETLLGTYECENTICGYASSTVTDSSYGINYHQTETGRAIPMFNNRFALIRDTNDLTDTSTFLFDITNNLAYKDSMYTSVNDYSVGIVDNLIIAVNESNKYGVIELDDDFTVAIPFNYDFIGLKDDTDENGELIADYFITLQNGVWHIIDRNEAVLTEDIHEPIIDYTGTYIITQVNAEIYHLVDYNNTPVVNTNFKRLSFTDRYVNCFTQDNYFYVYDPANDEIISDTYEVTDEDEVITAIDTNNCLAISINGNVRETINLS